MYTPPLRESLQEGGYVSASPIEDGEYILTDEDGNRELWFANQHHANYGILLEDGTELEFARTLTTGEYQ